MVSGLPYGYANAKEGLESTFVSVMVTRLLVSQQGCLKMGGLYPNEVNHIRLVQSGMRFCWWRGLDDIGTSSHGAESSETAQI